ncbi:SAM-dependent methyltransferase [Paenarthrobacter sp. NPDC089989]|uniref:SAM-dependent methyltransferase n=1 Tax=unclassified Paenarthrobacter TaxID=2634190 RepID=UPI0037F13A19
MTSVYVPEKKAVADFYDNAIPMFSRLDTNVHVGYWDSPNDTSTMQQATIRMTDIVAEHLAAEPGHRILDVGCGLGAPAIRIAQGVDVEIVGIATSPKLIEAANKAAREAGVADRVTFEVVDAEELPYAASTFDSVIAIESLVHMPNRARVFRNISHILRPGGKLALTDRIEIATPTAHERKVVEGYRKLAFQSPFMKLDDYVAVMMDANLLPLKFRDITEETSRHQIHTIQSLNRQAMELKDVYDAKVIEECKLVFEACYKARLPTNMLMVASRGRGPC